MKPVVPLLVLALAACAPAATPPPESAGVLPPPGLGSLRQDEISVELSAGPLRLKVTPLEEGVIRLAAPDTYERLHALAEARRGAAVRAAGPTAETFLVSFFSLEPDAAFQPEDLQLVHQGRQLRPAAILPLTSEWGRQRLRQQEPQTAVYVFAGPIDPELPMVVRYGATESAAWGEVIGRLEVERAKVRARRAP